MSHWQRKRALLWPKIRFLRESGLSYEAISCELGCSDKTVASTIREFDPDYKPSGRPRAGLGDPIVPHGLDTEHKRQDFVLDAFEIGYTLDAIGRGLGITKQRAHQLCNLARARRSPK